MSFNIQNAIENKLDNNVLSNVTKIAVAAFVAVLKAFKRFQRT